jgi:hypothetical protein
MRAAYAKKAPCRHTAGPSRTLIVFHQIYSTLCPVSPTEPGLPNTLHTDRPYISSSTWAQAAPACSGGASPYTVLVRFANWGPRGWPCPAGVGGDPPFPPFSLSRVNMRTPTLVCG